MYLLIILLCNVIFYVFKSLNRLYVDIYTCYTVSPVARIGLENSEYTVNENEGTIRVCAEVEIPDVPCGINFTFNISLHTSDMSAGI